MFYDLTIFLYAYVCILYVSKTYSINNAIAKYTVHIEQF